MNLFKVTELNYTDNDGMLITEARSKVKSTKCFPIYIRDGKKLILKPLSKTKPLTTPLFSFSEVYWSYVINKYFDFSAPRYYLAIASGIERDYPKYYEQGVLVESITPNDEALINLYDHFLAHPEPSVDIKDYTNYCMHNYDYTDILQSDFIKHNPSIGEELSRQILLSILRQDQNFHYENINFITEEDNIIIKPPIDFEFSTPFLFPDDAHSYHLYQNLYLNALNIKYQEDELSIIFKKMGLQLKSCLTNNICLIVKTYPHIVKEFITKLETFINDIPKIVISDPDNYIGPLNSEYYKVGHALYKDKNLELYEQEKEKNKLIEIDKKFIFYRIGQDILKFSKYYALLLKVYLFSYYKGIENLEDLTIKELLITLSIEEDCSIEDIDIDNEQMKLSKNIKEFLL